MAADAWRSQLGFSDRMVTNMKLKSACKAAFPDLSGAELQAKAAAAEQDILDRATSIDDYKALSQLATAELTQAAPSSEVAAPPAASAAPFEDIGPWRAQHHASGLFSTVYRATEPASGRAIAIKLTTPHRTGAPHDPEREARLLALAAGAPAVIPLLATRWLPGGHFCLLFPFMPLDLARLLTDARGLAAPSTRRHLRALFAALAAVHALGIVHRDVKPANLLLASPAGPAYLADFGISWRAGDPSAEPAAAKITDVGTSCYRAPELLFGGRAYGAPLDAWAAGCVVAECLRGGRPLFDAGDAGSELALVSSMFRTLGTPADTDWPEARALPDWGKMAFKIHPPTPWRDILPDADTHARDLVANLVTYESGRRLTAAQALEHPFFKGVEQQD